MKNNCNIQYFNLIYNIKNLKILSHSKANEWEIPVVKCVASQYIGIDELINVVQKHSHFISTNAARKIHLLTEKAYQLIQQKRMKDVSKMDLYELIKNKNHHPNK